MSKWILCKDKMPEGEQNVLVCFYDGRRRKVSKYPDGKKKSIRIDKLVTKYGNPPFWYKGNTPAVFAWMPLPDVCEELCDLMCGEPEDCDLNDLEEESDKIYTDEEKSC